jgi:hypothetical protein
MGLKPGGLKGLNSGGGAIKKGFSIGQNQEKKGLNIIPDPTDGQTKLTD